MTLQRPIRFPSALKVRSEVYYDHSFFQFWVSVGMGLSARSAVRLTSALVFDKINCCMMSLLVAIESPFFTSLSDLTLYSSSHFFKYCFLRVELSIIRPLIFWEYLSSTSETFSSKCSL